MLSCVFIVDITWCHAIFACCILLEHHWIWILMRGFWDKKNSCISPSVLTSSAARNLGLYVVEPMKRHFTMPQKNKGIYLRRGIQVFLRYYKVGWKTIDSSSSSSRKTLYESWDEWDNKWDSKQKIKKRRGSSTV